MDAPQLLDEMPQAPSATEMDDLQDDVLPIIVSFLPAHEAVRTCVLAKRWRHVWTSAPAIRITAVRGFESAKFNHFVDRLLSLRREGPCRLESCQFDMVEEDFDYDWYMSAEHLTDSLQNALNCGVQFLTCRFKPSDLDDNFAEDLREPVPLLSHHIQRLDFFFLRVNLDFSGCSTLVDLKMDTCVIYDDELVSNSLESLSIKNCQLYMGDRTSISLPKLIHLEFVDCFGKLPIFESLPSLETAIVRLGKYPEDRCSMTEIDGSVCLDNFCRDCKFSFDFDAGRGKSYLFEGLSQATHLEFSAFYEHAHILQRDLKYPLTFRKLKTLVLDDWCLDDDLSAVILFIQHSPNLEKVTLGPFGEFNSSMVTIGSDHPMVGASASDHLKMVEIKCDKVDQRINKVINILSNCGISQHKICIRQADTSL